MSNLEFMWNIQCIWFDFFRQELESPFDLIMTRLNKIVSSAIVPPRLCRVPATQEPQPPMSTICALVSMPASDTMRCTDRGGTPGRHMPRAPGELLRPLAMARMRHLYWTLVVWDRRCARLPRWLTLGRRCSSLWPHAAPLIMPSGTPPCARRSHCGTPAVPTPRGAVASAAGRGLRRRRSPSRRTRWWGGSWPFFPFYGEIVIHTCDYASEPENGFPREGVARSASSTYVNEWAAKGRMWASKTVGILNGPDEKRPRPKERLKFCLFSIRDR